jgi:hypothetical protein
MGTRKFGQQSQVAGARDAIQRFNAGVAARDTGARQAHEQQRASIANQQEMYNKGLIQQQFQNQVAKATGITGALGNQASHSMQRAGMDAAAAQQAAAGMRGLLVGGAQAAASGGMFRGNDGGVKYSDGGYNDDYVEEAPILDTKEELARKALAEKKARGIIKGLDTINEGFNTPAPAVPQAQQQDLGAMMRAAQAAQPDPLQAIRERVLAGQYADGGMNYEAGGQGTIIESGTENFAGDELPDRINDGEMVLNVEQQDRVASLLKELAERRRVDNQLENGEADVDAGQQEVLMAIARGEADPEDLPETPIVMPTADDLEDLLGQYRGGGVKNIETKIIDNEKIPEVCEEVTRGASKRAMLEKEGSAKQEKILERRDKIMEACEEDNQTGYQNGGMSYSPQYLNELAQQEALDQSQPSYEELLASILNPQSEPAEVLQSVGTPATFAEPEPVKPTQRIPATKSTKDSDPYGEEFVAESDEDYVEGIDDPNDFVQTRNSGRPGDKTATKKGDTELEEARRTDMIVDLLNNINQSLSHFDAANPNAILKPVQHRRAPAEMEKKLMQARALASSKGKDKALADYRNRQLDLQEKAIASREKIAAGSAEAKVKAAEVKAADKGAKATKKEAKELQSNLDDVRTKKEKIQRALNMLSELEGGMGLSDTGPIDQYTSRLTDQGQKTEQILNDLSLEKMTKMFAGMSKAIDSDAEREFFMRAQPNMGNYPAVNEEILKDMLKGAERLEKKIQTKMKGDTPAPASEKTQAASSAPKDGDTWEDDQYMYRRVNGKTQRKRK